MTWVWSAVLKVSSSGWYMSRSTFLFRGALAFLIAALVPAILFIVIAYFESDRSTKDFGALLFWGQMFSGFSFLVEIFFGAPVVYIMVRLRRTSFQDFVLVGVLAGVLAIILIALLSGRFYRLLSEPILGNFLGPVLFGFLEAVVFWLIARPDKFITKPTT
jgi:hypothetical protein